MIFFEKRRREEKSRDYFRYRDSLTGLMNREFCFKEYERLKRLGGYSAVTIRLSGCDCMNYYDATKRIKEAGELVARICKEDISRVDNGDFMLFSKDAERIEEKLLFFLEKISDKGEMYAVCCDKLDYNEDFLTFLRRMRRHMGANERDLQLRIL